MHHKEVILPSAAILKIIDFKELGSILLRHPDKKDFRI